MIWMWPKSVDSQELRFGVEIEFVEGDPEGVELLPGWVMSLDERQVDDAGEDSGAELKPPPMLWRDRELVREMLQRLRATGARANWSCGLHVHVGLQPWGQDMVLPLVDAALAHQDALRRLLRTAEDRMIYCPPVVPAMRSRYLTHPERSALVHRGRPQSHRCGINVAAWFDFGTVEIRYPNGSLEYSEVMNTVELCLRFVAAVGAGRLRKSVGGEGRAAAPADATALAAALGAPVDGYPPPAACGSRPRSPTAVLRPSVPGPVREGGCWNRNHNRSGALAPLRREGERYGCVLSDSAL